MTKRGGKCSRHLLPESTRCPSGCEGDVLLCRGPLRSKAWPRGFPWLSDRNKSIVLEANFFVDQCIESCLICYNCEGDFIFEHPEDLGVVQGIHPGSIWQWPEIHNLIATCRANCFAIHQCAFGAITPKPTRILTTLHTDDPRCLLKMPWFDKLDIYRGPLPRDCGHVHDVKLIGKDGDSWRTGPSAAYPAQMCEFLAGLILSSGRGFGRIRETPTDFGDEQELQGSPPQKKQKTVVDVDDEDSWMETGSLGNDGEPTDDVSKTSGVSVTPLPDPLREFHMDQCGNRGAPTDRKSVV